MRDHAIMGNSTQKAGATETYPFPSPEAGLPDDAIKSKRKSSGKDNPDFLGTIIEFLYPRKFSKADEAAYKAYFTRQRRGALLTMVAFGCFFIVAVLCLNALSLTEEHLKSLTIMAIFGIANLVLFCLTSFKLVNDWTLDYVMPYIVWFILALQLFCDLYFYYSASLTAADGVAWQMFFIFASFTMLPLQVVHIFLLSTLAIITHSVIVGVASGDTNKQYTMVQIGANLLLYGTAMLLGSFVYKFLDRKHRRAFLETKASRETKRLMQEQTQQQQDLLESVLPKHVADEVMVDFGRENTGQFSKIYIKRHENVSILFADIVGFTAMSSKLTAPELVKTLNALFANFDKLSEKHNQLRIKILGDCYYCICGVPDERPDHAVCSVSMGLDMVVAIKKVREETKSGVDMRVGIHTGAVLGGIMGKRMWQFDVWSKDVKMANNMESGGIPGRVHISEVTFSFINDEYEVEPGEGSKRSEYIKSSGLKTYLVKIPNTNGTRIVDDDELVEKPPISEDMSENDVPLEEADSNIDLVEINQKDPGEEQEAEEEEPGNQDETDLKIGNEIEGEWRKNSSILTMRFHDRDMESKFQQERDRQGALSLTCSILVVLAGFFVQLIMLPWTPVAFVTFIVSLVVIIIFSYVSMATVFPGLFPVAVARLSDKVNTNPWLRMSWLLTAIFVLAASDIVDMSQCSIYNSTEVGASSQCFRYLAANETGLNPRNGCVHIRYMDYNAILVLINLTALVKITHISKLLVSIVIVVLHCLMTLLLKADVFDVYDCTIRLELESELQYVDSKWTATLQLIVVGLALAYLNRNLEKTSRVLHFSKHLAKSQYEEVETMKTRNEQLVLNIMPAHVASHFMGSKKRDEELYSQNYKEVGVMFASIPNFADFYSEDAINNQGTECLRVLNEIFSDFDGLLDSKKFQNIHKIKTISSTYMAASGLFPEPEKINYETEKARWQHLADLTEFAFALKETLDSINQQSFNNFLLRIGINFGPVLAGVIGARKPHYDIWANAVNVASRMESTGKAGSVQVVEETMVLLRDLYGYKFEQRGLIKVKGKGELMTYFLVGKSDAGATELPNMIE